MIQSPLFREYIEAAPMAIFIADLEGRYQDVNSAACSMLGYSREELLQIQVGQILAPEDLERGWAHFQRTMKNTKAKEEVFRALRKDGSPFWLSVTAARVGPDRVLAHCQDVTERIEAQEKLLRREQELRESLQQVEFFHRLLESSGDCFYVVDLDDGGRMCYINAAAEKHYGASRDEICRWRVYDWDPNFTPESLAQFTLDIEKQSRLSLTSTHKVRGGKLVPVAITVNFMRDMNGTRLVYGWFRDITEQLATEAELRNAKTAAEAASQAKSQFLANMSHEIRTPLNGVIGFMDLLLRTPLSATQKQYSQSSHSCAKALLGIINNILDFSKIEAGKLDLEVIEVDIITLVEEALDIMKYQADVKGLELLLRLPPDLPRRALIDPVRLKQILINLLSNAVKFTEHGEVELQVAFAPRDGSRGTYHFTVRDTGIGIPPQQQEKLFEAFSQGDSSTTRKFGGTGLGLTISNFLAARMGSGLQVESLTGQGTTFSFSVETPGLGQENAPSPPPLPIRHALLVIPNGSLRSILASHLEYWKVTSTPAQNFPEALRHLENHSYDAVLLDEDLLEGRPADLPADFRELWPRAVQATPVILLHRSTHEIASREDWHRLGIHALLAKPVKFSEFQAQLAGIAGIAGITELGAPSTAEADPPSPSTTSSASTTSPAHVADDLLYPDLAPVIVLVDDFPVNLMLAAELIGQFIPRAVILEAENGQAALDFITSRAVDIVFMDLQMPVMDGLSATREIRQWEARSGKSPHLHIVALTAGALKDEEEKALAAGMDDFLTKPIDRRLLRACLARHLGAPTAE